MNIRDYVKQMKAPPDHEWDEYGKCIWCPAVKPVTESEPAHWARMREICTCPKPGTSNSSVDPLCPLALPHPWHRDSV